ncbi:hypothetical protein BCR44DRAFT_1444459 [Catenaria anguillulae PL171]|uniref:Uncharacterized protein n=1 Tax=Catenaria anguillulae PL171 TaxID=765915 RepID=A0A1Y2HA99_9FUNG|nr:hypothetical protein BCR44DRAFT_1444433 [Catenaria anguillulae PL171]ORZ30623.1 hypothetical protein BCR44DRAFT_1444459 [Catenaria anguillulae PL171]
MYPTHYLGQFYCYVHAKSTIGSALFFCTTSTACPPRSPPFLPFLSHFPTLRPFRSHPIIVCHDLLLHCCRPTRFAFPPIHIEWATDCALSCGIHAASVRSVLMELLAQV